MRCQVSLRATQSAFQCSCCKHVSRSTRRSDIVTYRGPSPKGRNVTGCRFAFSAGENLLDRVTVRYVQSSVLPFRNEFFRFGPYGRIMMNRVDSGVNDRSFRYAILTEIVILRRDTIKSTDRRRHRHKSSKGSTEQTE